MTKAGSVANAAKGVRAASANHVNPFKYGKKGGGIRAGLGNFAGGIMADIAFDTAWNSTETNKHYHFSE